MKPKLAVLAAAFFSLASTLRAQEPAWEVFGMPRGGRGDARSVASLSVDDARAVYIAALREMNEERRPATCLETSQLPHGQGYADLARGDTAALHVVATLVPLRFPCTAPDQNRFTVSQIYRVDSASVRVFILYSVPSLASGFAAEDVFLIRKEAGTWRVVARRNVMIT